MSGLDRNCPAPTEIKLYRKSRVSEITFSDRKRLITCASSALSAKPCGKQYLERMKARGASRE